MSSPADFPGDRGNAATTPSVAELISALTLPVIERLGTGIPEPNSRAEKVQAVTDDTIVALAALKVLEDSTAACKAALIERLDAAHALEVQELELDAWQRSVASLTLRSELACVLHIPESTAGTLLEHSTALVREHPATWAALNAGALSWRHAGTICDEIEILESTPGANVQDVSVFEQDLLRRAPKTTAASFKNTARRLRERAHPETIITRTRAAHLERGMTLEPGIDGMAWLTLNLPAPTAQGIWNHCTRLARTQQGPAESRTLTQLRIDTAATLLLAQPGGSTIPILAGPAQGHAAMREPSAEPANIRGATAQPAGPVGTSARDRRDTFWAGVDLQGEDSVADRLQGLEDLDTGRYVTEPPLPRAQILVTVPLLGLLGLSHEPAELEGYGPISNEIARRLLAKAPSFLRVLTDPFTGEVLASSPETYKVTRKMRLTLQARDKNCQFPGCRRHVFDTDLDHIVAWENGGQSTEANLEHLCRKHHLIKHFKDDKDRHGKYHVNKHPGHAKRKLRGWTPQVTADGTIGWTSPTGRYYPPAERDTTPPSYSGWLKKRIQQAIENPPANQAGTNYGSTEAGVA